MVANKGHLEKTRSQILPEAPGLKSVKWRGNRSVRRPVTKMSSCRAMARRSSSASISSPPLSSLPLTLAIWSRANAAATCQKQNIPLHHCLQNHPPVQGQSQPEELLPKAILGNMRASGSEARPVKMSLLSMLPQVLLSSWWLWMLGHSELLIAQLNCFTVNIQI